MGGLKTYCTSRWTNQSPIASGNRIAWNRQGKGEVRSRCRRGGGRRRRRRGRSGGRGPCRACRGWRRPPPASAAASAAAPTPSPPRRNRKIFSSSLLSARRRRRPCKRRPGRGKERNMGRLRGLWISPPGFLGWHFISSFRSVGSTRKNKSIFFWVFKKKIRMHGRHTQTY